MIEDIAIDNVDIKDISIPQWVTEPPKIINPAVPPVTTQIGVPVVDMPGCVEAHEQNSNKEKSGILSEDDPNGVKVFCDAGVPSFNPIDYNKDKLEFQREQKVPPVNPGKPPEADVGKTETPKDVVPKPECPTREQQLKNPVGKILEGNKKIVRYEVVGKECLMVTEKLTIPDQIIGNLPNAGMVTTTASIAVVATSSALLAKPVVDLLLKVVKPTVKKVMKKIATLRGKSPKIESLRDRRGQQRIRNKAIRILKGRE